MSTPNLRVVRLRLVVTDYETGAIVNAAELDEDVREYIVQICAPRAAMRWDRGLEPVYPSKGGIAAGNAT